MLHSMASLPKSERSSLLNSAGLPIIQSALINQIQLEAKRASEVDSSVEAQKTSSTSLSCLSESENAITDADEEEEDDDASTNPSTSTTDSCKTKNL